MDSISLWNVCAHFKNVRIIFNSHKTEIYPPPPRWSSRKLEFHDHKWIFRCRQLKWMCAIHFLNGRMRHYTKLCTFHRLEFSDSWHYENWLGECLIYLYGMVSYPWSHTRTPAIHVRCDGSVPVQRFRGVNDVLPRKKYWWIIIRKILLDLVSFCIGFREWAKEFMIFTKCHW